MKNQIYASIHKAIACTLFTMLLLSSASFAQVSGTKTIGVDYATITAAVADLNTVGASGAVIINVPAGYTETAPAGGIALGTSTLNRRKGSGSCSSTCLSVSWRDAPLNGARPARHS